MQYKNLHIKRLTKKQWQGFILPIGYTTDCHYKTEIKNVGGNFTVSLRMEHFPSPVTHTPDENDFPDRLHRQKLPQNRSRQISHEYSKAQGDGARLQNGDFRNAVVQH